MHKQEICLFCDLLNGKEEHQNGYKFRIIKDLGKTISFLPIHFPSKKGGDILIIPKEHYENLDEVPPSILHELIGHVSLIGKLIKKSNEGYNVLLNNGAVAGQYVNHVHFHMISRNKNDKITWEKREDYSLSKEEHEKLQKKLIKEMENSKR